MSTSTYETQKKNRKVILWGHKRQICTPKGRILSKKIKISHWKLIKSTSGEETIRGYEEKVQNECQTLSRYVWRF